jgi:PPOX class probable F420-dependent enzyme
VPAAPRIERPDFDPSYGISTAPPSMAWSTIEEQLRSARSYWICTTRADGRPHAMPVWGIWQDGELIFSTGTGSVKGRNLRRDPRVVAHLESGDDVVVLEGTVAEVTEPDVLAPWVDAYEEKYSFRPDPSDEDGVVYRVVAERAYTWIEQDFPNTAARWRWD